MIKNLYKIRARQRMLRARRTRAKLKGSITRPRLSVYRSSRHIFVQLIDDARGVTLLSLHDARLPAPHTAKGSAPQGAGARTKVEAARQLGEALAREALKSHIKEVVFDRGRYAYHGRVKAVAEGARQGGLKF